MSLLLALQGAPQQQLLRDEALPVEARGVLVRSEDLLVEWIVGVFCEQSLPVEMLVTIKRNEILPVEDLQGVDSDGALPVEAEGALATDGSLPVEDISGVATDGTLPIEMVAGVRTDGPLPIETLAGVRQDGSLPVETEAGVLRDETLPVEFVPAAVGTRLDFTTSAEYGAQFPYGAIEYGQMDVHVLARDEELPVENTSAAVAQTRLNRDEALPVEILQASVEIFGFALGPGGAPFVRADVVPMFTMGGHLKTKQKRMPKRKKKGLGFTVQPMPNPRVVVATIHFAGRPPTRRRIMQSERRQIPFVRSTLRLPPLPSEWTPSRMARDEDELLLLGVL